MTAPHPKTPSTAAAAPTRTWRDMLKPEHTPFVYPPIRTVPRAALEALVARLVAEGIGYGG